MSDQDEVIFETQIGGWGIAYIFVWAFFFIICAVSSGALFYSFWILGEDFFYNRPPSTQVSGIVIALIAFVSYLYFIPSIMIPINTVKYFSRRPLFRLTPNSIWDARISPPDIPVGKILSIQFIINKFGELIGLRLKVEQKHLYKQSFYWAPFIYEEAIFLKKRDSVCVSFFETRRNKELVLMLKAFANNHDIPFTSNRPIEAKYR